MIKNGLYIGKFAPFHKGHLHSIIEASTLCENLYVIVSQNSSSIKKRCEENHVNFFSLADTVAWIEFELKEFVDHITVISFSEDSMPEWPNSWDNWAQEAKRSLREIGKSIDEFEAVLGGEPEVYDEDISRYLGKHLRYVEIDPKCTAVPISASKIMSNLYGYWDYLPRVVQKHFIKRILITGIESCGKSTLAQKLAKYFSTTYSDEFGKAYEIDVVTPLGREWTIEDFDLIAKEQLKQDDKQAALANRIVFIDTDAIVTDYYLGLFLDLESRSTYINQLSEEEKGKWDLVILLQPTVPWIQDGTRWDLMKDQSFRWEYHQKLKEMYDRNQVEYVELGGDYLERYQNSIQLVKNIIKMD